MSGPYSSKDELGKAPRYTQNTGEGVAESQTHSSTRVLHDQKPVKVLSCCIAAEHALEHIRKQMPFISRAFAKRIIPQSAYSIQAGFDESVFGYLEQIHIFVGKARVSSCLRSDLGKLCSPFSAILFTDSHRYELPLFKADGSIVELRRLDSQTAFLTKHDMAGKTPLSVVSCLMTPNMHNIRDGGQDKLSDPGKGEEAEKNGEEFSGTTEISFTMSSDVYSADNSEYPFTVLVNGTLTIETTPTALNPPRWAERCVKFGMFNFNISWNKTDITYKQIQASVAVDSKQTGAFASDFHPPESFHCPEDLMPLPSPSGCAGVMNALLSVLPGVTQQPKPRSIIVDPQSPFDELIFREVREDRGQICWRFRNEDPLLRDGGIDMEAVDISPSVRFKYVGDVPEPPPPSIDIVVASLWSMIPSEADPPKKWVRNLLEDQQKHPTTYSNLVHAVFIEPRLDSPIMLSTSSRYVATSVMRQERDANEQFKIDLGIVDGTSFLDRSFFMSLNKMQKEYIYQCSVTFNSHHNVMGANGCSADEIASTICNSFDRTDSPAELDCRFDVVLAMGAFLAKGSSKRGQVVKKRYL